MKQQKYTSTEAGLEYRKVNREFRTKMEAAEEEWTEEQCKSIEKEMMPGNSKEAYTSLRLSPRPNSISQQSSRTAAETS